MTVQPEVITLDMINAVEAKGLFYLPDPSGNINENSGDLRGLKYGVTRDYVLAIVGSEGTIGIITEATLKLIPIPEF
ncbi:hypothetical protein GCM10010916_16630 [Paenibacillus abyssi]|uniref:FAD-binding PCMH-type domain-containing protein n=1 Tax=Paenibacillus abyssi TaxID=1340531 RepID=A0A917CUK3_9BACL|nr:hypothetical protein GCM10010916_16630 [Paenibacillus abyssi]